MTVEEIATAASDYSCVPDDSIDIADRVLWWTLRGVYEDYRRGVLRLGAAQEMKNNALAQYRLDAGQMSMLRGLTKAQAERWKEVEVAARNYATGSGRTKEGDALFASLYGEVLKPLEEQS